MGLFPTLIYIEVPTRHIAWFQAAQTELMAEYENNGIDTLKKADSRISFHLSLSQSLLLDHLGIEAFREMMSETCRGFSPCVVRVSRSDVREMVGEDRTYVTLLAAENNLLRSLCEAIQSAASRVLKQPSPHETFLPHVSLFSMKSTKKIEAPPVSQKATRRKPAIEDLLGRDSSSDDDDDHVSWPVGSLCLLIGCKKFPLPLGGASSSDEDGQRETPRTDSPRDSENLHIPRWRE